MSEPWEFFDDIFDLLVQNNSLFCEDEMKAKILKFIHSYVKDEIDKYKFRVNEATENVKYEYDVNKIDICRSNILKIKDLLDESEEFRDTFIWIFPLWAKHRKENVEKLNKIAKTLHDEKKIINAVKILSSFVGVAAGAAILASIFFPPVAAAVTTVPSWLGGSTVAAFLPSFFRKAPIPVKSMWGMVGGAAAATGGLSQFGTAITEIMLLKTHIDEAKSILNEDKETFTQMNKWLNHTDRFGKAMESLLNASVWKIVLEDFRAFLNMFNKLRSRLKHDEIISKLKCFIITMSGKIDVHNLYPPEYTIAIVCLLFVIFLIYRDNRILLGCILATINIGSALNVLGVGVKTAPAVAAMTTTGAMAGVKRAPTVLVRDATVGIFAGVGMTLDAANLVLTTIDVAKGSVSKPGKEVEEISNELNEEFKVLEEVNLELVSIRRNELFYGRLHY